MNAILTRPRPWLMRALMRLCLTHLLRWVETDIAAMYAERDGLPARIAEHEGVAARLRVQIALNQDPPGRRWWRDLWASAALLSALALAGVFNQLRE